MIDTVPDILARIVAHKLWERTQSRASIADLERNAKALRHSRRDFRAALLGTGPQIIGEIKKASPSKGLLSANFDPAALAREYQTGGAAALSVLTDEHFFQGSLEDLRTAREAVRIPVLRKDFTLDEYHVLEAAANGADAILLIVAILDAARIRTLRELAAQYGMSALVEAHNEAEVDTALDAGADIIGINNRDLKTFDVKLETSLRLAERIPPNVVKVAESGIHSASDIEILRKAGFQAFLVGERLMKSSSPADEIRSLKGRRMMVKVCGITNSEDAFAAVESGASALGFNFYPESPRYIDPKRAADIVKMLPASVWKVGVFVNETPERIAEIALRTGLDVVQLHGDEQAADFPSELRVWKAFRVDANFRPADLDQCPAEAVLLDTPSKTAYGGTGRTFDWSVAAGLNKRIILAGGLDASNVRQAIAAGNPWGVDVCSRIESAPGRKDHVKMAQFFEGSEIMTTEPDAGGHFGVYGGRYVPEVLMSPLEELEIAYREAQQDPAFHAELDLLLHTYAGRPTPLYFARRLSETLGGARLYFKREDLLHTGAHKINNALGQALLARRMGKKRIIAETGAGQHGVATATVCALFGLECVVYMGEEDMRRQRLNVFRMRLLGAKVAAVATGSRTLKDAISEAMRDWVTNVSTTHYLLGSALGSHPYPLMVRDFHKVIGEETKAQILEAEGRLPDRVIACVGGGSNAIGIFHAFIPEPKVRLIGVEAGGRSSRLGEHAARFSGGRPGVLHGSYSYLLQDDDGQVSLTHSVSAGLDYASVGPEHALLRDLGRAEYVSASDYQALEAASRLSRAEGLIPALESAHAVAEAIRLAPAAKGEIFVINLSGRGDKDIDIYRENFPELDSK